MNYATSGRYSFSYMSPIILARCDFKCTPEIGSMLSRPTKAYIFKVQVLIETFSFFKPNFFFYSNLGTTALLQPFHSAVLLSHFNPQLLVCSSSSPLLSHTGITSSDYNNNSNELTGKWQLRSDRSSGLNWFTAAHNGFYSQGPAVTNTTHMLWVHL